MSKHRFTFSIHSSDTLGTYWASCSCEKWSSCNTHDMLIRQHAKHKANALYGASTDRLELERDRNTWKLIAEKNKDMIDSLDTDVTHWKFKAKETAARVKFLEAMAPSKLAAEVNSLKAELTLRVQQVDNQANEISRFRTLATDYRDTLTEIKDLIGRLDD